MSGEVWSPLMWAVKDNNTPVLQQLIADGHDPNERVCPSSNPNPKPNPNPSPSPSPSPNPNPVTVTL